MEHKTPAIEIWPHYVSSCLDYAHNKCQQADYKESDTNTASHTYTNLGAQGA